MAATTDVPTYNDLVTEAQTQALSSLKQAQEFWLKATETAVGLVPADPSFALTPNAPTAKEVVTASFGFSGKVFEAQKGYAIRLAEILDAAAAKATPAA